MDFDSIVKGLAEAIEGENGLRIEKAVNDMPAQTIQYSERKESNTLHPSQKKIALALLQGGKSSQQVAELLSYPLEEVQKIEAELLQTV